MQGTNKFDKAKAVMRENNIDGWLIICNENSDINAPFLLGVSAHARHYIFVPSSEKDVPEILAVDMEVPMIKKSLDGKGIKAKVNAYNDLNQIMTSMNKWLLNKRIALNYGENMLQNSDTAFADYIRGGDLLALQQEFKNANFCSSAPLIYALRCQKTVEELQDLRDTCKATIEILEKIPDMIKAGMTEKDLGAKLDYEYMRLGKPSFDTIIGSGANSADPHHNTSLKKIEKNNVLLIDSGLKIKEMCSDLTWTWWIGPKSPPDDFIQAYQTLYDGKIIANQYYTVGTPALMAYTKIKEFFGQKGYDHEKLFNHGLGHSLGYEVHDIGARINSQAKEAILEENMVYSNEPGFYWQGKWGIRLEDDIIIKKDECEQVTYVPKNPIMLKI
jgi:Xaa-Pro aminopeptidase